MVRRIVTAIARWLRRGPKVVVHTGYIDAPVEEIDDDIDAFVAKHTPF